MLTSAFTILVFLSLFSLTFYFSLSLPFPLSISLLSPFFPPSLSLSFLLSYTHFRIVAASDRGTERRRVSINGEVAEKYHHDGNIDGSFILLDGIIRAILFDSPMERFPYHYLYIIPPVFATIPPHPIPLPNEDFTNTYKLTPSASSSTLL